MCGIAGFYARPGAAFDVDPMSRAIAHRGPDEARELRDGSVQLAIRRLSIIDLVTGSQPIANESGTVHVVYNGEIFNFRALRDELAAKGHVFTTRTDTEVLVHGYEEWGERVVDRLNGQFAFAIRDGDRLFLARDRMGEKPLYWARTDDGFFFASEIKGLLPHVPTRPRVEESYWVWDTALAPDTLFEGIEELPPAHTLSFDGRDVVIRRYWEIPNGEPSTRSESDLIEELRELLIDAVTIRLMSDVDLGIFLSGGIDSAAIACIAKPDIAFTCRFPLGSKFDEFPYAELVAKHVGARQVVVTPTAEDFRAKLPSVIGSLDQPVATASVIAEFMLAEAARDHGIKVILGGQGADEVFGGYVRYLLMAWEDRLARSEELASYQSLARYFWNPRMFGDPAHRYFELVARYRPERPEPYFELVRRMFARHAALVDRMGNFDAHVSLPSLLTMNDRACAAVGLENRCPFLDHRLIEFGFRLPERCKIDENGTKRILRKALRGIVPDAILDRRDKKGLVVPFHDWLFGPLDAWARDLETSLAARIDMPGNGSPRGEFDRGRYSRVSLELWFRNYFPEHRRNAR